MGSLRDGQEYMHYSDQSHRWIAPPDEDQKSWDEKLHWHLDQHLATMGGAPDLREYMSSAWREGPLPF